MISFLEKPSHILRTPASIYYIDSDSGTKNKETDSNIRRPTEIPNISM